MPKPPKPDDPEQSRPFREAAQEHGISSAEAARLDETRKRIVPPRPKVEKPETEESCR